MRYSETHLDPRSLLKELWIYILGIDPKLSSFMYHFRDFYHILLPPVLLFALYILMDSFFTHFFQMNLF